MIEPNTSVAPSVATSRDAHPHTDAYISLSRSYTCAHCQMGGTTVAGALWRVSSCAACDQLFYLHTACLQPYKIAHGLRSVEGRVPLTHRAAPLGRAPAIMKRTLIDGRWRGRIARYPGTVHVWYELRARLANRSTVA